MFWIFFYANPIWILADPVEYGLLQSSFVEPDPDPESGFWWQKNWKKIQLKNSIFFLYQKCNLLTLRSPYRTSKLQEKLSALKREHPALQKMKFFNCFLFFWGIFDLLDPDTQHCCKGYCSWKVSRGIRELCHFSFRSQISSSSSWSNPCLISAPSIFQVPVPYSFYKYSRGKATLRFHELEFRNLCNF